MRVLTVRQPWAWAIIHGGKDVENRVRSLGPYRGPVAIHAGLSDDAASDVDPMIREAIVRTGDTSPYVRGAVIGVVDLTGSHRSKRSMTRSCLGEPVCFDDTTPTGRLCSPWAMPDHHHLVLENPRPLARLIPAKGRLGLWRPDAALEDAIREQIGEA